MSLIRRVSAKIDALRKFRFDESLERVLVNQGRIWAALNDVRPVQSLQDYEFKVFSQWGEDGVIQRLIQLVPILHRTFIEFGVEDFTESNCRFLLMNDNWRGHVIDGDTGNIAAIESAHYFWKHELTARAAFITPANIDALLDESGFDHDVGIMSIDIDGIDYWVLSAITRYRPRILIVEYNAVFGAERPITVPLDEAFRRSDAHHSLLYFGASLAAYRHWATNNDYLFVGATSTGSNAFFVRADLANDHVRAFAESAAFVPSRLREARDEHGQFTHATGEGRKTAIQGLPVVNVVTGETERL